MNGLSDNDEVRARLGECLWIGMSLAACGQTTAGGNSTTGTAATTASAVTSDGATVATTVTQSSGSGFAGNGSSTSTTSDGMPADSGGSGSSDGSGGSGGSDTAGTGTSGTGDAGETGVGGSGGATDVPGFDGLVIYSSTMSDYDGYTVYVAFDQNLTPDSRSEDRSAVITSGAFEVVWEQGFSRDTFGSFVFLFVDLDGDATCTEGVDPVWSFYVNNTFSEGEPLMAEFDLSPESTSASLMESDCQRFVEGA